MPLALLRVSTTWPSGVRFTNTLGSGAPSGPTWERFISTWESLVSGRSPKAGRSTNTAGSGRRVDRHMGALEVLRSPWSAADPRRLAAIQMPLVRERRVDRQGRFRSTWESLVSGRSPKTGRYTNHRWIGSAGWADIGFFPNTWESLVSTGVLNKGKGLNAVHGGRGREGVRQ